MDKQAFKNMVYGKIRFIDSDSPSSRVVKSDLKKSLNKPIENLSNLWGFIYSDYTLEKWNLKSSQESIDERALIDTLSLYALHTRYNSSPHSDDIDNNFPNFLKSLKGKINNTDNNSSFDKQVGQLLASPDYNHAIKLLRKFISLSKGTSTKINYPNFGWELLLLNTNKRKNVFYTWGKQYYSNSKPLTNEKE